MASVPSTSSRGAGALAVGGGVDALVGMPAEPPLPRAVTWLVMTLLGALAAWSAVARLDVVASAGGRVVPASQLRIVQPAEGGVLQAIHVREGDRVREGQALARMDTQSAQADARSVASELALRRLQLRRVDAELAGRALEALPADPPLLHAQVEAQREARVRAHENSLAEERAVIARSRREMQAAAETREKLAAALPHLREQEQAFERLANEGFAGRLMRQQRTRERVEAEQDVRAQEHKVEAARAAIEQAERRMAQIGAQYRAQLQGERVDTEGRVARLAEDAEKLAVRTRAAELRAPADGVIKDLATHTVGSVLSPGTVLMTLVPADERLLAEVWLRNEDAGFVRAGQAVRLKFAAYPFQKYGMAPGRVLRVSADASDRAAGERDAPPAAAYRAMVELEGAELRGPQARHAILPGMQVTAEILLMDRSVLEYLLSPVQKAAHEAGRER